MFSAAGLQGAGLGPVCARASVVANNNRADTAPSKGFVGLISKSPKITLSREIWISTRLFLGRADLETARRMLVVLHLHPTLRAASLIGTVAITQTAPHLSVNFRYVPNSCRHNHPSAIARAIPARNWSPLPPAARKASLTRSMKMRPSHRFDAVCDLDELVRGSIRIGEGMRCDELHAAAISRLAASPSPRDS